jgi:hypothetical protein
LEVGGCERLEENHDHILKELLLWNVKREKNMQSELEKKGREKEKEAEEKEGSRKMEHPTDFPSPQVQIGAHYASSPVSWGCESGGRGRMVERETESRIFLPENYVVLGYFQPRSYLEIFFLEKMGYACSGTLTVPIPQQYPCFIGPSSSRFFFLLSGFLISFMFFLPHQRELQRWS